MRAENAKEIRMASFLTGVSHSIQKLRYQNYESLRKDSLAQARQHRQRLIESGWVPTVAGTPFNVVLFLHCFICLHRPQTQKRALRRLRRQHTDRTCQ